MVADLVTAAGAYGASLHSCCKHRNVEAVVVVADLVTAAGAYHQEQGMVDVPYHHGVQVAVSEGHQEELLVHPHHQGVGVVIVHEVQMAVLGASELLVHPDYHQRVGVVIVQEEQVAL